MAIALNRTTITGALTAADTRVSFASAATLTAGQLAYIDREAMELQIQPAPGVPAVWQVLRGQCGTFAAPHAVNGAIFTGAPGSFAWTSPQGSATQATAVALPLINVITGDSFMVSGAGSWQKAGDDGVPAQMALASGTLATFTSNGAIAIQNGSVEINSASARAMTIAAPTLADEGTVLVIYGSGGGAHTVTPSGGFGGGTSTVATFGAGGGTLMLQVMTQKLRPIAAVGVTFT